MTRIEKEIIEIGNNKKISLYKRISTESSVGTILFIHGFGCNKDIFNSAFSDQTIAGYNLIVPDLPGHAESHLPDVYEDDFLLSSTKMLVEALNILNLTEFHICGHSMGGLIGIFLSELLPRNVNSFINLEGNLSFEDCTFTGQLKDYGFERFQDTERRVIEEEFAEMTKEDESADNYFKMFKSISSRTLYYSARDTVLVSREPDLFKRFTQIPNRFYIYGELNKGKNSSEKRLQSAGVPIYFIGKAGHAMQYDNPGELYRTLHECIGSIE